MNPRLLGFAFAALCALLPGASTAADEAALIAGVFDPPRLAPDFVLDGSDGTPLQLQRYRGKVVVLGFGYTHCPAVCPTTLAVLAAARRKLGTLGSAVQILYITVDPARDDVARMAEFLGHFDASFVGGSGSAAQLAAVRKDYGISATRIPWREGDGYGFDHSSYTILIDRAGRLRALMPYGHDAEDYVHDLKILLAQ